MPYRRACALSSRVCLIVTRVPYRLFQDILTYTRDLYDLSVKFVVNVITLSPTPCECLIDFTKMFKWAHIDWWDKVHCYVKTLSYTSFSCLIDFTKMFKQMLHNDWSDDVHCYVITLSLSSGVCLLEVCKLFKQIGAI